ncbi:3-carboxymuconate cyclase [Streptococcus pneumoniae]|nr:3-carboxymuconate cyclase [Streptococcus pneumoniae]
MKETVYFGTYTRRTSQGIYKADFDKKQMTCLMN